MFLELFKPKNRVAKYDNSSLVADQYDKYIHGEKKLDGMLTQVMPIREFREKLLYIIRGYPAVKVPRFTDNYIDFNAAKKIIQVINMVQHIPHIYGYISHKSYVSIYGQLQLMWHSIIDGKRAQVVVAFNSQYAKMYHYDLETGKHINRDYDSLSQAYHMNYVLENMIDRHKPMPYVHPVLTKAISNNQLENAVINSLLMVPVRYKTKNNYETIYEYYYNSGDIIIKALDNGYVMLGSPANKGFISMPFWNNDTIELLDQIGNTLKSQEYYVL